MAMTFFRLACLGRRPPALPEGWRLQGRLTAPPRRVVVDGSMLTHGRAVTQVCLPLSPVPRLTLRAGSGTLLLAAATTVMADTVPDEAALLSLAATLGFTPEKFLRGCPVLTETALGSVKGRVVRDGRGRRAYFLGDAATLAPLCRRIWEGSERPMTDTDRQRLPCPGGTAYALATAPMDGDTPGEATYLGSLLVEDAPCPAMLGAVDTLCARGLEVIIRRDSEPLRPEDLLVAAEAADAPCLIPPGPDAAGLDQAVVSVLSWARQADEQLRAAWQTTALMLLCGLLMQAGWPTTLFNTLLIALACFFGQELYQPARPRLRRVAAMVLPCLIAALAAAFLGLVMPGSAAQLRIIEHVGLCMVLLPQALCARRTGLILSAAVVVLPPVIYALAFQAGLASCFASLSGALCAVVYRSLTDAA